MRRRTGQLVVRAEDGKEYRIAFVDGVLVGASSPLAVDSIARIALTCHLVTSSHVPAITKQLAAARDRDEVDVVAEIAKLSVEHAVKLRRRMIIQRAARTFSIERGEYRFEDKITLPVSEAVDVDICAAIYLGVHMNLSEVRLAEDMRRLGSRFALNATADISRFGFTDLELAVVESLRGGASVPELDARHRDIAPRTQLAVVYALVACGACTVVEAAPPQPAAPPAPPSTAVVDLESRTRTSTWKPAEAARTTTTPAGRTPTRPEPARTTTPTREPARTTTRPGARTSTRPDARASQPNIVETSRARTISGGPVLPRTLTPRRNAFLVRETITNGIALVDAGADHYALLGVDREARLDAIRSAYVAMACVLHKDKLPELEPDLMHDAHRLFASVNTAFGVLCDPVRRAEYTTLLIDGKLETKVEVAAKPEPVNEADAAFQRGMLALKREDLISAVEELMRATDLAPNDVDYAAMLAWARFCASGDKHGIANEVRKVMQHAILRSPKPMMARFYLGRIERMLGRVREALYHFHEVIAIEPGHADAAAEIRLLEPRAANERRRR